MRKINLRQMITIFVTILTITLNILANALPFNGQGTGEISDRFDILFVPAGYVFSIWLLIYIGLAAFTIYQAKASRVEDPLLKKVAPAYWIANTANNVWLFLWHWEFFPLTLIAMAIILISLIYIYIQFIRTDKPLSRSEKWLVKAPFSVYLGWISVAIIANISQVLYFINWDGFGLSPVAWAVIMLLVATILGLYMLLKQHDVAYAMVLVWAFFGIGVSQSSISLVANTAYLGVGLLLVVSILIAIKQSKKVKQ